MMDVARILHFSPSTDSIGDHERWNGPLLWKGKGHGGSGLCARVYYLPYAEIEGVDMRNSQQIERS